MGSDLPLSRQEFDSIYARVPRLTVEVLVSDPQKGIYLTKRAIEPGKGQWHIPGGTVFFGESLRQAVQRVAKRELGIEVLQAEPAGYIEYPSFYKQGSNHAVGLVFRVTAYEGNISAKLEADDGGWFTAVPEDMLADQDNFLLKNGLLDSKD